MQQRNQGSSNVGSLSSKRQKISRACDRCRIIRTKCGNKPCSRCVLDGVKCTSTSVTSAASKPKSKIFGSTRSDYRTKTQARNRDGTDVSPGNSGRFPSSSTFSSSEDDGQWLKALTHATSGSELSLAERNRLDSENQNGQPSCPAHLSAKIEDFFASSKSSLHASTNGPSEDLEAVYPGPFPESPQSPVLSDTLSPCHEHLSEDQERYFLRLFWEAHHPLLQVSDGAEFQSLLGLDQQQTSEVRTLTKALTDCMTALGIQYGYAAGLTSRILGLRHCGAKICWIGYGYFCRCREFIAQVVEPTLLSMQCYALMSLYLVNASRFREAYSLLGTAIRLSHSVNLHEEPSGRLKPSDRISRKQIWWLLFMLDMRCSQQLGKPVAVQVAAITCSLPLLDELTARPGNTRDCWNNLHASTYFVHAVKFASTLAEIDRLIPASRSYEEVANFTELEQRASLLTNCIASLEKWSHELPKDLLNSRKNAGCTKAMPTSEDPIVLELGAPNWLHLQRLLLEVNYHNAYIMLQRPFICFSQASDLSSIQQPQTNGHARSALQHALTMIRIIHCVCSSSDVFSGWLVILHPLWNATVTVIGYILANPFASRSRRAIPSILESMAVFEGFAATETFAAQAQEWTGSLVPKLRDVLADLDGKLEDRSLGRIASGFPMQQSPETDLTTPSDNLTDLRSSDVRGEVEHSFRDPLSTDGNLCSSGGAVEVNTWEAYQSHLDTWNGDLTGVLDTMYLI